MLGTTSATRRTKDVPSTSTNGARPKSIHDPDDQTSTRSDNGIDADHLTLWQHPIVTLNFFVRELLIDCLNFARKAFQYRRSVFCIVTLLTLFFALARFSGPQQQVKILL